VATDAGTEGFRAGPRFERLKEVIPGLPAVGTSAVTDRGGARKIKKLIVYRLDGPSRRADEVRLGLCKRGEEVGWRTRRKERRLRWGNKIKKNDMRIGTDPERRHITKESGLKGGRFVDQKDGGVETVIQLSSW